MASPIRKCRRGKPSLGSTKFGCIGLKSIEVVSPIFNSFSTFYRHDYSLTSVRGVSRDTSSGMKTMMHTQIASELIVEAVFGALQKSTLVQHGFVPLPLVYQSSYTRDLSLLNQ